MGSAITWVTSKELTELKATPSAISSIVRRAKKEGWVFRKRTGVKGVVFEYDVQCLPSDWRDELKNQFYNSILNNRSQEVAAREIAKRKAAAQEKGSKLELMRQCPALLAREVQQLTTRQKQIADARAALAMEVEKLRDSGLSRTAAVAYVANNSRNGTLPAHLQEAAKHANARPGSTRTGVGTRSLQEWLTIFETTKPGVERMAMLAPGHLKARRPEQIKWLPMFLAHWRSLNGPSLREAYASFCHEWQMTYSDQPAIAAACPSYDAVRRAMVKLPRRERANGRVSGSAKLAYETYVTRDWSQMPVNGVWIADGKSLDMKVAHPVHGRPFTPELTLVLDGRTRFCVGWSLGLSENVVAVADAYRYAMKRYGKPLLTYSDNGGGETNKTLDADITGIFPRMGIEHTTSIPGRPQSRGIIERLNGVIPRRIAMNFETFNGPSADREHVRMTGRRIQSAVKALENGRELNPVQRNALAQLPSWQQLIDIIEDEVEKYNATHQHRELPKRGARHMTPAEYRRAVLEAEGDEIEYLTDVELHEMFMPEEIRVASRGYVSLLNNDYFSQDLINVDGEKVRVAFDIHDASQVIIRRMDGSYVCTAIFGGNKRAAMPVSKMETLQEKRRQRRLQRIDEQRDEIEAESRGLLSGSVMPDFSSIIPHHIEEPEKEYFFLATDRDEHIRKTGNQK